MKTSIAIVLGICCFVQIASRAHADNQPASNARIKALQKQRLAVAIAARDDLFNQLRADDLRDDVNTPGFTQQLLEAHKLVFLARIDLSDSNADRAKAIEQSIDDFKPTLAIFERHFQNRIVGSTAPFRLAQALLLEMQIAAEKAK